MHCLTAEASVIDQKNPQDVGLKRLKACETHLSILAIAMNHWTIVSKADEERAPG